MTAAPLTGADSADSTKPADSGRSLPTGDPGVDALVALAGQTGRLPAGEHKAVYTQVLEGLERELDSDPQAAMRGAVS